MNTYKLTVTREAGNDPISGASLTAASEVLTIQAPTLRKAYSLVGIHQTLQFRGQMRRVYDESGAELFHDS